MPDIDFSGLMTGAKDKKENGVSFKGLMQSPEVKPLSNEQNDDYVQRMVDAPENVANMVEKRGTLWEQYTADTSTLGVGKTFLQNIALPSEMLEAGISNPVVEMQKGNFNPIDLISESARGFAGLKQGEYGDIGLQAGLPSIAASSLGLATSFLAPLALMKAGKNFSSVSKFADLRIAKSVNAFFKKVKGLGGAMNKYGGKVGSYYDDIGSVTVNKGQFLDELADMSTNVKKSVVDMPVGKMAQVEDDLLNLAEKGDVISVHKAKEVVDDLINNFFTSTSKTQSALRKSSKNLGNIIDDGVLVSKTRQIGSKGAEKYVAGFQKARKNYSVLKNNFGYIQKKLINPQTGKPTQTGSILRDISDPRNINSRAVLRELNKFGTKANKFAREMEAIEGAIKFREFTGSAIRSAGRGLVIGATAGQILRRTGDDQSMGGQN